MKFLNLSLFDYRNDQLYDQRVTKKFVLPLAEYANLKYEENYI
jgi:hypothetical protein